MCVSPLKKKIQDEGFELRTMDSEARTLTARLPRFL